MTSMTLWQQLLKKMRNARYLKPSRIFSRIGKDRKILIFECAFLEDQRSTGIQSLSIRDIIFWSIQRELLRLWVRYLIQQEVHQRKSISQTSSGPFWQISANRLTSANIFSSRKIAKWNSICKHNVADQAYRLPFLSVLSAWTFIAVITSNRFQIV